MKKCFEQTTYTQEYVKNYRKREENSCEKVIHKMWIMWKSKWEYVFVSKNTMK